VTEHACISLFSITIMKHLKLVTSLIKEVYVAQSSGGSRAWCQHWLSSGEELMVGGHTMEGVCVCKTDCTVRRETRE
jgi:hypothetical protein